MLEYYCFIYISFQRLKILQHRTQTKKHRKHFIYQVFAAIFSGKEGIRTPEALLTLTRFPGGPLQPLEHLSVIEEIEYYLLDFSRLEGFFLYYPPSFASAKIQNFFNTAVKY